MLEVFAEENCVSIVELPLRNIPTKGASDVQFRLTYKGPLLSNGDAKAKQALRQAFHPQLRELWRTDPHLQLWLNGLLLTGNHPVSSYTEVERLAANHTIGPFNFVPLITKDLGLACSLDILLLRRERPGRVVVDGDVDNRIKTLFDGLKRPGNWDEAAGQDPLEDEKPFFVLMENDDLITELRVEADRLLQPKGVLEPPENVELIITVRTKIIDYRRAYVDMGF